MKCSQLQNKVIKNLWYARFRPLIEYTFSLSRWCRVRKRGHEALFLLASPLLIDDMISLISDSPYCTVKLHKAYRSNIASSYLADTLEALTYRMAYIRRHFDVGLPALAHLLFDIRASLLPPIARWHAGGWLYFSWWLREFYMVPILLRYFDAIPRIFASGTFRRIWRRYFRYEFITMQKKSRIIILRDFAVYFRHEFNICLMAIEDIARDILLLMPRAYGAYATLLLCHSSRFIFGRATMAIHYILDLEMRCTAGAFDEGAEAALMPTTFHAE